jgi:hypothetical protein
MKSRKREGKIKENQILQASKETQPATTDSVKNLKLTQQTGRQLTAPFIEDNGSCARNNER